MPKQHSLLKITIDQHNPLSPDTITTIEVDGCGECLRQAITKALLTNETFKTLINTAVRAANIERQKTQN